MTEGIKFNQLICNDSDVTDDGKYLFFSRSESKVREDGSTYRVGKKSLGGCSGY